MESLYTSRSLSPCQPKELEGITLHLKKFISPCKTTIKIGIMVKQDQLLIKYWRLLKLLVLYYSVNLVSLTFFTLFSLISSYHILCYFIFWYSIKQGQSTHLFVRSLVKNKSCLTEPQGTSNTVSFHCNRFLFSYGCLLDSFIFYVLSTLLGYLKPKHVMDGKNNSLAGEYPINMFFF